MESLHTTATRTLKTLLANQPTDAAKVAFAWRMAAGATLGQATKTAWTDDGVLRVTATSAAWRREVNRARPMIAARLNEMLGPGVVRSMVVEAPVERRR